MHSDSCENNEILLPTQSISTRDQYPNLLIGRRHPDEEVDPKSPVRVPVHEATVVRITADPPETIYLETDAVKGRAPRGPAPRDPVTPSPEATTRRITWGALTEQNDLDALDRSPAALTRIRTRKPTPVFTKAEMVLALEDDSDAEKHPEAAKDEQATGAASAGKERTGSFWRGRSKKRRGTGFLSNNRLRQVLSMYGEEAP